MDWKELAAKLTELAPAFGSLFGPIGAGVGTAISVLAKAFGLQPNAKPEEIYEAVKADSEAHLKLIIAENEFKLKQREQDIDELKARLTDVQSARAREVELVKTTGKREANQYILAWTVILGFFGLIVALMKITPPQGATEVVYMLFGALATGFITVLQYFFGSSKGSSEKTTLLARAEPIK